MAQSPGYPPPTEFTGPRPTITPEERTARPTPNEDPTVTIMTPAGVEREKEKSGSPAGTTVGAPGRGWGPGNALPYWDFNKAIQQTVYLTWAAGSVACYAFAVGYLFGVFPLHPRLTPRERTEIVQDVRDETIETLQKEGWHR